MLTISGHAAFARADIPDAKRRRPAADLAGYAQARGLDQLGSRNAVGFLGAQPFEEELQFNVLRGALPGGAHGIVFHELLLWPMGADGEPVGSYAFHGYRYSGGRFGAKDLLGFVPVIGSFVTMGDHETRAIAIPCTIAAAHAPGASAAGDFHLDNQPHGWGGPKVKLGDGWTLERDEDLAPGFEERLPASGLAELLRELGDRPYVKLMHVHGTVVLRVNGYVSDPDELDRLGHVVSRAAAAIAEAARPLGAPQPFATALPAPDWPEEGTSISRRWPPDPWLSQLHAFVRGNGLALEDPVAFRAAFPAAPVPGRCVSVARGVLPGTHATGRVAWFNERDCGAYNVGRTALLLPASPGAAPTSWLGERDAARGVQVAVHDGIVAVSVLRGSNVRGDLGDLATLFGAGLDLVRERGLAAV